MNKWLFVLILMMSGMASPAVAQSSNIYYGLGINEANLEVPGNSSQSVTGLSASVGTQLTDRIGIELALGTGSDDPESLFSSAPVQYQAGLLRFSHAWSNKEVYLLLGHARLDIASDLNPIRGGNAWGIGLNLFGSKHTAINAQILSFGAGTVTSAGIGIQYFVGGLR